MKYLVLLLIFSGCSSVKTYLHNNLELVTKYKKPIFKVGWNKNIRPSYETGNLPIVFNSPVIYKKRIFVGHNKGFFQSHDLLTGRQLWSKFDGGQYYSSPVIVGDSVIYGTSEGRVYSRDIFDGKLNYEIVVGDPVESSPVHVNGRLFFHLRNHQVFCLDVKTGKTLWSYKKSIANTTTLQSSSSPVIDQNYVLVGFADGTLASLRIETGELRWEQVVGTGNKFNDVDTSPVVIGEKVYAYADGQQLVEIDVNSGVVTNRLDYFPSSDFYSFDNRVFFGDKNGKVYFINKDSGDITPFNLETDASVKYVRPWKNGIAIFGSNGKINFYKVENSKFVKSSNESFHIGSRGSSIISSPKVDGDNLVVTSSLGRIVYFK